MTRVPATLAFLCLAACAVAVDEPVGSLELAILNPDGSTAAGEIRVTVTLAGTNELIASVTRNDDGASSPTVRVGRLFAGAYGIAAAQFADGDPAPVAQAFGYVTVDGQQPASLSLTLRRTGNGGQGGSNVHVAAQTSFGPRLIATLSSHETIVPGDTVTYTILAAPNAADPAGTVQVLRSRFGSSDREEVPEVSPGRFETTVSYPAGVDPVWLELDVINPASGVGTRLSARTPLVGASWTETTVELVENGDIWGTLRGVGQAFTWRNDTLGKSFLRLWTIDGLGPTLLFGEQSRFVDFAGNEAIVDLDGNGVLDHLDVIALMGNGGGGPKPYRAIVGSRMHGFAQHAALQAIPEGDGEVFLSWGPGEDPSIVGYHVYRSDDGGATFGRIMSDLTTPGVVDSTIAPGTRPYYYIAGLLSDGTEAASSNVATTTRY